MHCAAAAAMQLKKREKFERIEFSLRECLLNGGLPWVFWHWPCGSGDPVIWDTLLGMLCYTLLICTAVRLFRIDHVQHCTLSKQQSLVVPPSTPLHFNNFLAAKFNSCTRLVTVADRSTASRRSACCAKELVTLALGRSDAPRVMVRGK